MSLPDKAGVPVAVGATSIQGSPLVPSEDPASEGPPAASIGEDAGEAPASSRAGPAAGVGRPPVRQRSELEIRWRQARNAPPPVVRAVLANVAVAFVGGVLLLVVDWLASHGTLPESWASVAPVVYVTVVIVSGTLLTYLWVELPTGRAGERRRSGWSAVLGFFASIPIVYLALVVIFQVLRPLLG
jgi:hypothetical protein